MWDQRSKAEDQKARRHTTHTSHQSQVLLFSGKSPTTHYKNVGYRARAIIETCTLHAYAVRLSLATCPPDQAKQVKRKEIMALLCCWLARHAGTPAGRVE